MPKKNPKHNSLRLQRKNQLIPRGVYIPGGNTLRAPGWKSPQNRAKNLRTQQKYLDILHDIEECIATINADHPELDDAQVIRALRALLYAYTTGNSVPPALSPLATEIYADVQQVLAWRIRDVPGSRAVFRPLLDSLECVIDSAEFWHRQGGVRGYLEYMSQFL